MARWQEKPEVGNSVWTLEDGNGTIEYIDYNNRLVLVHFHYLKKDTTIELDSFFGCLDERLNQWIIA